MHTISLLHLTHPISQGPDPRTGRERFCSHYIGIAHDVTARFAEHKAGHGARLTQVAVERGNGLVLARTWEAEDEHTARGVEKQLKGRHAGSRLCPVCKSEAALAEPETGFNLPAWVMEG